MTMHIVQIIDGLYRGGAQQLLVTFAAEAQRRGFRTTVISLNADDRGSVIAARLHELGAEVVRFPAGRLLDPVRVWRLSNFLRRIQPSVVQTHLTYANIIGTLAGRLASISTVGTLHIVGSDPNLSARKQHLENAILRRWSGAIIAVGYAAAESYKAIFSQRQINVVPNAVDVLPPISATERTMIRTELLGDPSRPFLLSVGRLTSIKALPDMIDAFAILAPTQPEARLIMVGSGDQRDLVLQRIAQHGLADRVSLIGARDDVPRLLRSADVFVSSSSREGLPVAILEAMAAGLPIVGTAVGDVPHVVVPGTGLVVPPNQPQRLGAALKQVLADPVERRVMGIAAAAHVVKHHSPAVWLDQLIGVYNGLR